MLAQRCKDVCRNFGTSVWYQGDVQMLEPGEQGMLQRKM